MGETWLLRSSRGGIRAFDSVLLFFAGKPASVAKAFHMLKGDSDALNSHIHVTLDSIDSKASPLLTSVSMMTGVAMMMARVGSPTYVESVIFGATTVMYLFLSLCCIRSLSYVDLIGRYGELEQQVGGKEDRAALHYHDDIREEVLRRVAAINFVSAVMYPLTILFALTVLITVIF